jgi:hypothetical protein
VRPSEMLKIEKEQALNSAYEIGRVLLRRPEKGHLVPGRGLEPPRCYPLVPETSASTNSATRAHQDMGNGRRGNLRTAYGAVN